ncbi:phosphoglycerate kinase [Blattabacterium cuenoti]|uniref:phosphoglycerate kinase n=1 Tax=Blattabacterium cuenoti TaxID=1653831 RepID=UPI00163C390B|nr:phosphoglycerate kinase [Blattabacterium cuenoti]
MKKIKDINDFDFYNKKALLRVDFNVPVNNFQEITDDTRIRYTIPTIQKILSDQGKVIIISHFGRPQEIKSKNYSLKFLLPYLSKLLKSPIFFCEKCIGKSVEEKIQKLKNGEIILLENLRFHKEEEKGNQKFAFELSKFGDIYVNDAFGASHRDHSSITILPKFFKNKKCIGLLMKKEIHNLNKLLLGNVKRPMTIILGGAKISSKINIIKRFIKISDYLLLGGIMSYPFIKKTGGHIGNSLITENNNENDKNFDQIVNNILSINNKTKNLILPKDIIALSENNKNIQNFSIFCIPKGWKGLDIGKESIKYFCDIITKSRTILWNGPMGKLELPKFSLGTISIAKKIAEVTTEKNYYSIVGGGDSIYALKKAKCINNISYISTGGGAMLEMLKNKNLPGIKAIKN